MPCWWAPTRPKQLSMAATARVILLCQCEGTGHTAELVWVLQSSWLIVRRKLFQIKVFILFGFHCASAFFFSDGHSSFFFSFEAEKCIVGDPEADSGSKGTWVYEDERSQGWKFLPLIYCMCHFEKNVVLFTNRWPQSAGNPTAKVGVGHKVEFGARYQ